ncbi:hypothetical protein K458DRAFT_388351 [Lentithecium fluviatile CBS 122367]|uniref:Uncharacterized protein n=1 Tax=Lentithecium fluviatile CBS 122367 TaxID=1168545 RepID=A0A6G1J4Y9_9PLEO|nr:hypothetical protein K458DRAFT_388351 [Lentithecium fluviatile CBS 122367]
MNFCSVQVRAKASVDSFTQRHRNSHQPLAGYKSSSLKSGSVIPSYTFDFQERPLPISYMHYVFMEDPTPILSDDPDPHFQEPSPLAKSIVFTNSELKDKPILATSQGIIQGLLDSSFSKDVCRNYTMTSWLFYKLRNLPSPIPPWKTRLPRSLSFPPIGFTALTMYITEHGDENPVIPASRFASSDIANINELVEMILLHLPFRPILRCQRACTFWKECIAGSKEIQGRLYKVPLLLEETDSVSHFDRMRDSDGIMFV